MIRVVEHPKENKPMRLRCGNCTALLEFTVADVARIQGASFVTCPVCALEVTLATAVEPG